MSLRTLLVRTVLLSLLVPPLVQAQLSEDFSKPLDPLVWMEVDTSITPTGVQPWGPGNFDTTSGMLNLRTTNVVPIVRPWSPLTSGFMAVGWIPTADPQYSDGTVRAKVRADTDVGVSINLRSDIPTFSSYNFVGSPVSENFIIQRFVNGTGTFLAEVPDVTFSRGEDWWMEATAFEDQLAMKVWEVGASEPASPQVLIADSTLTSGIVGLGAGLGNDNLEPVAVNAVFDDISFRPLTELPLGDCTFNGSLQATDLSCVTTIEERDAVLEALGSLPGDLDGDGEVAFTDFLQLSANFGQDAATYSDGNIDLDAGVEFADFLALSENFGMRPDIAASVPEPIAKQLWFCIPVFGLMLRRRTQRP